MLIIVVDFHERSTPHSIMLLNFKKILIFYQHRELPLSCKFI